jgi:Spy/CpxP family protein refolding chaperone
MKSPKTKLVLALIAMFVFGAVSGAGLTLFCHSPFFPPPRPEEMQKVMTSFFTRRLNLTPDQQEKLRPITADFANQATTLHAQSINQLSQLAAETDSRIAEILTPEQKVLLEKLAKERDEDFQKYGGPPGP